MSNDKVSVGLLRPGGRPDYQGLAMAYIGQHKGIEVYVFGIDDVDINSKKINARKLSDSLWVSEVIDYPLIIDNDNTKSMNNKLVFNDLSKNCYMTTQVLGGKLKTLKLLSDNNIFTECLIPQVIIKNRKDFVSFINLYEETVLKPIIGSQGKNIFFFTLKDNKIYINFEGKITELDSLDKFYDSVIVGKNFIIQKYIKSTTLQGAPFDIRIHVQRDGNNEWRNTKTYVRIGTGEGMTANIATGGAIANVKPFIEKRYKKESLNVLKKINRVTKDLPNLFQQFYEKEIDSLGIDLGVDNNGNLWIFEINSFPGTKFFELEEAIIRVNYLKYLHNREKKKINISLIDVFSYKNLWQSNLLIDSKLRSENNIAISQSSGSKIGVSKKFIKENIEKISLIICDKESYSNEYPKEKVFLLENKEDQIISACAAKINEVNPFVYTIIGSVGKTSVLKLLSKSLKSIETGIYVNSFGNTPFYIAKGVIAAPLRNTNWIFEVAGASDFRGEPISVHSHKMLQPDVCIFTNIAEAHVGKIGSLKEIAIMKSKALSIVPDSCIVILNADMPYQDIIKSNINPLANLYTFGDSNDADFRLLVSEDGVLSFLYNEKEYFVNIPNGLPIELKLNFLSVVVALMLTKKDWKRACEYFKEWKPVKGRGNIEFKEVNNKNLTIINDSYNANPISMKLAISSLDKKISSGRKVAVLGEISELGNHSNRIHKDLLDFLSESGLDKILFIGESYKQYSSLYSNDNKYIFYANILDFKKYFSDLIVDDDLILFKGSHSSKLYDFLNEI